MSWTGYDVRQTSKFAIEIDKLMSMLDKSRVTKQIYSYKYERKTYICPIRCIKYHNMTNYITLLSSSTDSSKILQFCKLYI